MLRKYPSPTILTHNAAEKTGRGVKKLRFFASALQLNINHILLRQAEIDKYYTSTHKATDAHVSRCAELLSKVSHLLLWLLHWEFSSKEGKKCRSLLVFLDLTHGVNIIRNVRDVSGKTAAY